MFPKFDLVDYVVLDPMHMTDIGKNKKLLLEGTDQGKPGVKISDDDRKRLSERVISSRSDVSDDFARNRDQLVFKSWAVGK